MYCTLNISMHYTLYLYITYDYNSAIYLHGHLFTTLSYIVSLLNLIHILRISFNFIGIFNIM